MMKIIVNLIILVLACVQITACGGGRGSTDDTGGGKVEHKTPDGIWHGSINTTDLDNKSVTYNMNVIISKDQFFATTSSNVSSKVVPQDIYSGEVLLSANGINGQVIIFLSDGSAKTVSLSGSVSEQSILSGNINGKDFFSLNFDVNYDRPVSLTTLSGVWEIPQGTLTSPLMITGDKITGIISANCQFQGTLLQPIPTKNSFITTNATISAVTGSSCIISGSYSTIVTLETADRLALLLTDITNNTYSFVLTFVKKNTSVKINIVDY